MLGLLYRASAFHATAFDVHTCLFHRGLKTLQNLQLDFRLDALDWISLKCVFSSYLCDVLLAARTAGNLLCFCDLIPNRLNSVFSAIPLYN